VPKDAQEEPIGRTREAGRLSGNHPGLSAISAERTGGAEWIASVLP
jgi:hypothetical protein